MNRRYRVSVPSIRSATNRVSEELITEVSSSGDMAHDLDGLAAAGALPVVKSRDTAGKSPPLDERRTTGRAVRVLERVMSDVSEIRKPDPEFFCPGTDLLEQGNRSGAAIRHPVIRVERREMH